MESSYTRPVEAEPSTGAIMANSGTPFAVAVVVGFAFAFLIAVRAGFRGSIPQ